MEQGGISLGAEGPSLSVVLIVDKTVKVLRGNIDISGQQMPKSPREDQRSSIIQDDKRDLTLAFLKSASDGMQVRSKVIVENRTAEQITRLLEVHWNE